MPKRFGTGLDFSDRQGTDAPGREEWAIAVIWLAVYMLALGSPMVSKAIELPTVNASFWPTANIERAP